MNIDDYLKKPLFKAKKETELFTRTEKKIEEGFVEESLGPQDRDVEKEFREVLDKAIYSVRGLNKIIEQIPEKSIVAADPKTKSAIKRVFGIESDVVTFELYQEALRQREKIFEKLREGMSSEQFK